MQEGNRSGDIQFFRIIVKTNKQLKIHHSFILDRPNPEGELNISSVHRATINAFTNIFRKGRLLEEEEFQSLGANLYEVLLANDIGKLLHDLLNENDVNALKEGDILRLELEFEEDENGSKNDTLEYLSWPWEYLYSRQLDRFLSQITQLVLTRRLFLREQTARSLRIKDGEKPKVLLVSASPIDPKDPEKYTQVQIDTILEILKEEANKDKIKLVEPILIASGSGNGQIEINGRTVQMRPATWKSFQNVVAHQTPHIIHFIGHGHFGRAKDQSGKEIGKEMGGLIFLAGDDDNSADWINEERIATQLSRKADLRLVFLQACESGMVGSIANPGPYRAISGVAGKLAAVNIPAVVAMQAKISNKESNRFAKEFYKMLLSSRTIEAAVLEGREMLIKDLGGDWSISKAFGLPVLYLRNPLSRNAKDVNILLAPPIEQHQSINSSSQFFSATQPKTTDQFFSATQPKTTETGNCPCCGKQYRIGISLCGECAIDFFCSVCNTNLLEAIAYRDKVCPNRSCKEPIHYPRPKDMPSAQVDNFSTPNREKTGPL